MTMNVDMPLRQQNPYTEIVGQMMDLYSKTKDPANDFGQFLEALGLASGFLIGSILEREARKELLEAYLQQVTDATSNCSQLHLIANSDAGIKAD